MAGAFSVGSVVAEIKADITNFKDGLEKAQESTKSLKNSIVKVGEGIADFGQKAAIVTAALGAGFGLFIKSSIEDANDFSKAMTTLDIIAGRFGISGAAAQEAAKNLGKELRIGVGPAAESIQNLLKSGLNLDQASDLLKRFTNEAITGKSPQISLAQAVQNLSFAYNTQNSALGNMSGISENFIDIIDRGRAALLEQGKSLNEITDDQAKYAGMIELTNLTLGSAERFTGTLIDKQAQLDQKILELKTSVGLIAAEVITPLVAKLAEWVDAIANWVTENKATIEDWALKASAAAQLVFDWIQKFVVYLIENKEYVVAFFIVIAAAIGVWVAAMVIAHAGVIAIVAVLTLLIGWVIKSKDQIIDFAQSVIDRFNAIVATVKSSFNLIVAAFSSMIGRIRDFGNSLLDAIMWPFNEAKKRIDEAVNYIKDKLDFTKRHSPSVIDIINRGVNLANQAFDGLEFNTNFTTRNAQAAVIGATSAGNAVALPSINIDLTGAIIADESSAMRISEMIGDNIIKKLHQSVRT